MGFITHTKVSVMADDPNYDILPSDWNAAHTIPASVPNITTTATSDMIFGAAGAWVKKTLAEALDLLAAGLASITGKTTPVDADTILISDSAASNVAKKVTWANIKATLKTYLDTLYYGTANVTFVASDFSKTSDTTLADVTGLTFNVVAGGKYRFIARLMNTCASAGGLKASVSGTATATVINYFVTLHTPTSAAREYNNALDGDYGAASNYVRVDLDGFIHVNAGGTLTIKFAQFTSNGTPSVVLAGSWFEVERIA